MLDQRGSASMVIMPRSIANSGVCVARLLRRA
jgi:hypothetical protein